MQHLLEAPFGARGRRQAVFAAKPGSRIAGKAELQSRKTHRGVLMLGRCPHALAPVQAFLFLALPKILIRLDDVLPAKLSQRSLPRGLSHAPA